MADGFLEGFVIGTKENHRRFDRSSVVRYARSSMNDPDYPALFDQSISTGEAALCALVSSQTINRLFDRRILLGRRIFETRRIFVSSLRQMMQQNGTPMHELDKQYPPDHTLHYVI
jgi:hypothetical protein